MARQVDKTERRQFILEVGEEVLREGGLAALQMREVARRAGVAAGTTYLYFPTKESLFAALYARRLSEMLSEIEELTADSSGDPRVLFIRFAGMYRDMYAEFGREVDVAAFITTESMVDPTTLEELVRVTSRMAVAMQAILAKFEVKQPEVALPVVWSLLSGLAAHFTGPRSAFHQVGWDQALEFTADRLLDAFLSGGKQSNA